MLWSGQGGRGRCWRPGPRTAWGGRFGRGGIGSRYGDGVGRQRSAREPARAGDGCGARKLGAGPGDGCNAGWAPSESARTRCDGAGRAAGVDVHRRVGKRRRGIWGTWPRAGRFDKSAPQDAHPRMPGNGRRPRANREQDAPSRNFAEGPPPRMQRPARIGQRAARATEPGGASRPEIAWITLWGGKEPQRERKTVTTNDHD